MDNQRIETTTTLEEKTVNCEDLNIASRAIFEKTQPGTLWDVFRRLDVPKLIEYLRIHWKDFGKTESLINDVATRPLYDADIFLNRNHKRKLNEDFGVEPWSFEQHLGRAVFIPTGCPFIV